MTRRIAFVNEKGGSAKTTLTSSLAAYYALRRGRRVLALDFDPQGQLGKVLGADVHGARRSAVELVVSALLDPHRQTGDAIPLTYDDGRELRDQVIDRATRLRIDRQGIGLANRQVRSEDPAERTGSGQRELPNQVNLARAAPIRH